jgi:hypothetical protein
MDKGKNKESMDPIMMEEDHIKKIMEKVGKTHSGIPYQYKMNNKKRDILDREGLANDEEEVEDLWDVENIEEIPYETYENKTRVPGLGIGGTPIHITISVEPTTPCVTNTPERTPTFRQPNFSGRRTIGHGPNQVKSNGGEISGSNSQLSTPRRGSSSTQFKMAGHDPMIKLPEFRGEASKNPEKYLFIYEKILEEN